MHTRPLSLSPWNRGPAFFPDLLQSNQSQCSLNRVTRLTIREDRKTCPRNYAANAGHRSFQLNGQFQSLRHGQNAQASQTLLPRVSFWSPALWYHYRDTRLECVLRPFSQTFPRTNLEWQTPSLLSLYLGLRLATDKRVGHEEQGGLTEPPFAKASLHHKKHRKCL